jgi:hypothetical protein
VCHTSVAGENNSDLCTFFATKFVKVYEVLSAIEAIKGLLPESIQEYDSPTS